MEMFDLQIFCEMLNQKLIEHGIEYQDFINSEYGDALSETISSVPLEDRAYTARDLDFFVKINHALINKFRKQLNDEYGTTMDDVTAMFHELYEEEYHRDPRLWYEQGMGFNEEEEKED